MEEEYSVDPGRLLAAAAAFANDPGNFSLLSKYYIFLIFI